MVIETFELDRAQLQNYANNVLVEVVRSLSKEQFLTTVQMNDILKNYSVIIEDKRWLPEFLCRWLKLENKTVFRLARAIGREPLKTQVEDELSPDDKK